MRTWKSNAKMDIIEVGVKLWSGFNWLEDSFQARKSLVSQNIQTRAGIHLASCSFEPGRCFPGNEAVLL
jgi:hypothetical protein